MEDIHIAAANAQVCSFENLSSLSQDMQDALCILSTGGGYATRQLYTNGEEHVITSKRPVMLNGINAVATAPDLIERVITIELPTIAAGKRQDEQTMEAAWLRDYPAIFTGLLTLFAEALEMLPKVEIPEGMQKRMLDYQRLGEAVCRRQGRGVLATTRQHARRLPRPRAGVLRRSSRHPDTCGTARGAGVGRHLPAATERAKQDARD